MNDGREIRLRILIQASQEAVFEHWTRADLLGKWFLEASHQGSAGKPWPADKAVEEGCRYQWTWANGISESGEFTQVEPSSLLALTFGDQIDVVVRFGEMEGRTLVEVRQTQEQSNLEARWSVCLDCTQGWTFYLTNLKSVLEGGVDLREREFPDISNANV
jgi:uncharacterized protein YndB with AHSA1/START domain